MANFLAIGLVLLGTLFSGISSLLVKKGSVSLPLLQLWRSRSIWIGFFLYGISTLLYIIALRQEELSVIYPLVSTTYIWTTILAVRFLGEKINVWKVVGIVGIVLGVTLISWGS